MAEDKEDGFCWHWQPTELSLKDFPNWVVSFSRMIRKFLLYIFGSFPNKGFNDLICLICFLLVREENWRSRARLLQDGGRRRNRTVSFFPCAISIYCI